MKRKSIFGLFSAKPQVVMKRCKHCGQILPMDEFYKNAHYTNGRASYCKVCIKQVQKQYKANKKANIMTNTFTIEDFGKAVKERRLTMGLTQKQVANKAGVTYQTVLKLEQGGSMNMEKMTAILNALGMQLVITDGHENN